MKTPDQKKKEQNVSLNNSFYKDYNDHITLNISVKDHRNSVSSNFNKKGIEAKNTSVLMTELLAGCSFEISFTEKFFLEFSPSSLSVLPSIASLFSGHCDCD